MQSQSKYSVVFPGNTTDISTFGGTPYFLIDALVRSGLDTGGLNIPKSDDFSYVRAGWTALELARRRGRGGFQYSDTYLNRAWKGLITPIQSHSIISLYQLVPKQILANRTQTLIFYFDQTLKQLFENYPDMKHMSAVHKQEAMRREQQCYKRANTIICKSQWAANSVEIDYQIDRSKIFIVPPGGNVDHVTYKEWIATAELGDRLGTATDSREKIVKFLFIGKDAYRKGLHRFLAAMQLIPDCERRMSLTVVGATKSDVPSELAETPGVKWLGLVNKHKNATTFNNLIATHDVGILLSSAEAGGISLREFQMFGLATIAPLVGGAPEMIGPETGILVEPSASAAHIAQLTNKLLEDSTMLLNMKRAAWSAKHTFTWDYSAMQIRKAIEQTANTVTQ